MVRPRFAEYIIKASEVEPNDALVEGLELDLRVQGLSWCQNKREIKAHATK